MPDIPATPVSTLNRARDIARQQGINYVYTGNVHNKDGDTTYCPNCQTALIERDWYQINQYRITENGNCPDCGTAIAGRFDKTAGNFGRNRIPVAINRM
jgi:pyruvate formate lyase activating enzyme